MAVEVVAVADEVGISAELEAVESGLASDVIVRSAEDSHATTEKLVKLLPPLVDFAVIKQGQSISSAATRIEQR
ncbi:hypothetical protein QTG54_010286 [Skeletonema marinoi]|uniref:Uncharacterized protein n=1 Tax=Skeletonema marinoi TaxID=267567 RepID=A0AAD8Y4G6_9STRA|nr:hypothetical protein QTG54_010286 [Skeletonema marinoi]